MLRFVQFVLDEKFPSFSRPFTGLFEKGSVEVVETQYLSDRKYPFKFHRYVSRARPSYMECRVSLNS